MVFQDHRLLPWLKIKDNVGFGLGDLPKQERDEKVRKHLERVGLANNPTILLLDEPFGALDALVVRCVNRALHDLEPERSRRLDGLVNIGIDETSYKKDHKYITVIVNHDINTVVWAAEGHGSP